MAWPLVIGMSAAREAPAGRAGDADVSKGLAARPILSALQENFPVSILLTGSLA